MAKDSKIFGMVFSILFHLFIVFLFLYHPRQYVQTGGTVTQSTEVTLKIIDPETKKKPAIKVDIIPETKVSENAITIPVEKIEVQEKTVKYETDATICKGKDKDYVGVGFIWQPSTFMITRVPMGLPAYNAGIREGDFFVAAGEISPAGYITFNIKRRYEFLVFHIKAEKICFQEG